MSFIEKLWKIMINYGYDVRINKKDGLERWNFVKPLFPPFSLNWKESSKKIYNDLVELGVNNSETSEESGLSHVEWERNHYLLQHGRIIYKNPEGSLVRLMQIAYNIGQFRAEQEKKSYSVKQLTYYRTHKLDLLNTYIDNISKLPDDIVDKLKINLQKAGKH